jgi:hypothetical protein
MSTYLSTTMDTKQCIMDLREMIRLIGERKDRNVAAAASKPTLTVEQNARFEVGLGLMVDFCRELGAMADAWEQGMAAYRVTELAAMVQARAKIDARGWRNRNPGAEPPNEQVIKNHYSSSRARGHLGPVAVACLGKAWEEYRAAFLVAIRSEEVA